MQNSQIILNDEQEHAVTTVIDWLDKLGSLSDLNAFAGIGQMYRLGGFAGTGKTTIIKSLLRRANKHAINVCAFTGKAAHVLRMKGVEAGTIHSLIYEPKKDDATGKVQFVLRNPWDLHCDFIIVDEASMVSHQLFSDLKSFNKPVLYVGDPGQLEPIGDNPNLMKEPDLTLKHIHRQALDSPICELATKIREGGKSYVPRKFGDHLPGVRFITKNLKPEDLYSVDQVICARNLTRSTLNNLFRRNSGWAAFDGLHEGEKLICTKNDSKLGVFNGMILFVDKIVSETRDQFICVVTIEGTDTKIHLPIWSTPFYAETSEHDRCPQETARCDFGYAITCHKSQGSEWTKVMVVEEYLGRDSDMGRWRYTAVTRASENLVYAS